MPIKPENRHRYPADWPAIRARILARAGNACEKCKAPNRTRIARGAGPEELARFDVGTKRCTANCGPHRADPRSEAEQMLLCGDCLTIERKDMRDQECKHGVRAPHECTACVWETPDLAIWIRRIHDLADDAHTQDDGHCFALSEIVAMCRAAMVAQQASA